MSASQLSPSSQFEGTWKNNGAYFEMLRFMAGLSRLFSENSIPYLDYRLAENLFCKHYSALNDDRSCMAYDARIGRLGIGIKTFGISRDSSVEKIAEFNKLKEHLDPLKGKELAVRLAQFRNQRMDAADAAYGVTDAIYHIVGRKDSKLVIFNSPYKRINIDAISDVKDTKTSISFTDGVDFYTFNKSKSVLMKRFGIPEDFVELDVDMLEDPLGMLHEALHRDMPAMPAFEPRVKGLDYVVLPLFSTRGGTRRVPQKSGLNQWNAGGRRRDPDEVYIPIPKVVHERFPGFFPDKDCPFELLLPDGEVMSAKLCQAGSKALMSNPNSALGRWILRRVLHVPEGRMVTMDDLASFGIDSVLVEDMHTLNAEGQRQYRISFTDLGYEPFGEFIDE